VSISTGAWKETPSWCGFLRNLQQSSREEWRGDRKKEIGIIKKKCASHAQEATEGGKTDEGGKTLSYWSGGLP